MLARVADLFARAEVAYAVIGAHGVNAWLEPRFTADIDVTARIDPPAMLRLRRACLPKESASPHPKISLCCS